MLCSVSWYLSFLLFISIPIASADWNFDPQAADNNPSPQLSVFATNNEIPENLILDPAVTGVRVEDNSATASDQSQGSTLSNGFELASDQTDPIIPEGQFMAEGEGCLPDGGRSSRKMRLRRGQGICELNPTRQFREEGSQPNTEQQHKPQGQITGAKKPGKNSPGDGKKRKTSVTVHRVTPDDEPRAEEWFPKESRPQSDKNRCRTPDYTIPVCANFVDSVEMFPAVMGLGPVCILVPATACMFFLQSLQLISKKIFRFSYIHERSLIICSALCRPATWMVLPNDRPCFHSKHIKIVNLERWALRNWLDNFKTI